MLEVGLVGGVVEDDVYYLAGDSNHNDLAEYLVWAIVTRDVVLLRKESASLLARLDIKPSEQ